MLSTQEQRKLKSYVAEDSKRLSQIFDALSDNNRCQLFRVFTKQADLNVSEVASTLNMSVPLASQHLKVLEKNNLLTRTKRGRQVFYSVNQRDPLVSSIVKAIQP